MNNDLISREDLLKALKSNCKPEICHDYGTNWCEVCCPHNDFEDLIDNAPTVAVSCKDCDGYEAGYSAGLKDAERPQGECRTCRHRDPEDKKCDCGEQERQGCPFPVSDDYFCKFYEKGGAE